MRAFIALELPDEFRGEVAAVSRILAQSCQGRFLPYENLHVTLAFLGDIGEAESSVAIATLEEACSGVAPIPLDPEGLGKFGRRSDCTLWMGLRESDGLGSLAARVRECLGVRGISYDVKPFRAHVTLARRVRLPSGDLPELPFPRPQKASRVTLFRSLLDSSGATYKPLHTVELV